MWRQLVRDTRGVGRTCRRAFPPPITTNSSSVIIPSFPVVLPSPSSSRRISLSSSPPPRYRILFVLISTLTLSFGPVNTIPRSRRSFKSRRDRTFLPFEEESVLKRNRNPVQLESARIAHVSNRFFSNGPPKISIAACSPSR